VDLGRAPAARSADGLRVFPPLAPEAERWAFTAELSNEKVRWWSTGAGECLEQIDPHALCRPADIAIVERLARSVDTRRIDPARTGLQHLNDAAYDAAVIDARLASRVGWQMRRDPSELRVRKPEVISIHRLLPRGSLESRRQTEANGFMGLGPSKLRTRRRIASLPNSFGFDPSGSEHHLA